MQGLLSQRGNLPERQTGFAVLPVRRLVHRQVLRGEVDVRLHRGRHRRIRRFHHHPRAAHLDDLRPGEQDEEGVAREDPRRCHGSEWLSGM